MHPNKVKAMWREGQPAIACWMSSADSYLAETIAHIGFDAVVLDMQHGMTIGPEKAGAWLQGVSHGDSVPMVRMAWNEPYLMQWVLDAGAHGVIVPLVNNAEEAAKAARACRYPPIGMRSSPPNRARLYADDYVERANDEIICLVMVESINTIPHLDEMAQVPGIDGFYIGPNDLALSMGIPGTKYLDYEAHGEASLKVVEAARAHGLVAGIHCATPEEVRMRFQQGFMFCPAANDVRLLTAGATQNLRAARGG